MLLRNYDYDHRLIRLYFLFVKRDTRGAGLQSIWGETTTTHNHHKSCHEGSSPPQVEDFSVSKTFTRTSVRVSKMNAVACAQITFQMLTLLQTYLYHQSQYSKTWDSKCLPLAAQMVRAFGMNPKFGARVPLRSRHFLSQKLWHFHKNIRSCVKN